MKKRSLFICIALLAAASTVQATTITSIAAMDVDTSFSNISGNLIMDSEAEIEVEYATEYITYSGSFNLTTHIELDTSLGGIASANFTGGTFSFMNGTDVLLAGTIISFNLTEYLNGSGMFVGEGSFTVTGGTLQPDFGPVGSLGDMANFTISVRPRSISNFTSTSFSNASSTMTILPSSDPTPEPATVCLLALGSLVFTRKKK